ncbi:MAG: ARMT1-like domain-containing protein, partial [Lentisphaeria bacterium]|nr:ARMT1-like domain-containing protein [Lentisphaeria bacterium]
MRTYLDCYSCLVQQAVDAGRRAGADPVVQERILREALTALSQADLSLPPPLCARRIGEIIQRHTGVEDPYLADKRRSNEFALSLLDRCRAHLVSSPDPLATAIRQAAAGNIIEYARHGAVTEGLEWVESSIAHALEAPLAPAVLDR